MIMGTTRRTYRSQCVHVPTGWFERSVHPARRFKPASDRRNPAQAGWVIPLSALQRSFSYQGPNSFGAFVRGPPAGWFWRSAFSSARWSAASHSRVSRAVVTVSFSDGAIQHT